MAKKRRARKTSVWKSKKWYTALAPEMFGKTPIGESVADDPEKLIGRAIETTLGDITNDYSKQNTKLIFKLTEVNGNKLSSKFVGHNMTGDYMRSLVKRRSTRIDANTDATTADGYKVRVKSSCFTIQKSRANQIKAIRGIMDAVVRERAKTLDLSQYVQEMVLGKLAADIYKESKHIYPMRRAEIEKSRVIGVP